VRPSHTAPQRKKPTHGEKETEAKERKKKKKQNENPPKPTSKNLPSPFL
jgi:hypothetical protein